MSTTAAVPRSFVIISAVALLWNLLGIMSYIMQVTMSSETLAQMPEAERILMESMPSWTTGAFAIAVFGGTLGCLALLIKKAWAIPVLLMSLIAIVIQMGYWLFMTEAGEVHGTEVFVMPLLVTVIAVFLVWYSMGAKTKRWLG